MDWRNGIMEWKRPFIQMDIGDKEEEEEKAAMIAIQCNPLYCIRFVMFSFFESQTFPHKHTE